MLRQVLLETALSVSIKLAGIAVLCAVTSVTALGISVNSDAKSVQPTPRQTRSPQFGPAPPGAVPAKWRVQCRGGDEPIRCQAYQSVYRTSTGEHLISVVVQVGGESQEPLMRIRFPLGIHIGYGASVQIGHASATELALESCNQKGCFAEFAISQTEIAALIKGERMKISVRDSQRRIVRYRVSGAGFAEAYAKIR